TVDRLSGGERYLPILQHVALSNKHINHPGMGPYILADAEPVDAGGVEATKKAFFAAVDRGLYNAADHHFLWLWDNVPHTEALDLLLTVISRLAVVHDNFTEMHAFKHGAGAIGERRPSVGHLLREEHGGLRGGGRAALRVGRHRCSTCW